MRTSRFGYAVSISAAALLAACGGSQAPIGALGAMQQTSRIAAHTHSAKSWMLPEARKIKKLLYVSDFAIGGDVYVFNYDTGAPLGELSNTGAQGQCVDAQGDVWITGLGVAAEYAHGRIWPTKKLTTNGYSVGCSVSPNGDLAVANSAGESSSEPAYVQVWRHASGSPVNYYSNACPMPGPPGYDDKSNLYFESVVYGNGPQLVCLLAKGARQIQQVSFNHKLVAAGSVQWDGKYLALTDSNYKEKHLTAIYRVQELRSGDLKIIGKTILYDSSCVNGSDNKEYWLFIVGSKNTPVNHEEGDVVVGGDMLCNNRFDYWTYPTGGSQTKSLSSQWAPTTPQGESVSIAP